MKIQTKLSVLLAAVLIFLVSAVAVFQYVDGQRIEQLYRREITERSIVFDQIVSLNNKSLELFVSDYSNWDDMITFIHKPDSVWAESNIDAVLSKFNVQLSWLCDRSFNVVYTTHINYTENNELIRTVTRDFQKSANSGLFKHFYVLVGDTLMEIRTAPVQPSRDVHRTTEPAGYLFVGRVWNDRYVKELADATQSDMYISKSDACLLEDHVLPRDTIVVTRAFKNFSEKTIGWASSIQKVEEFTELDRQANLQFILLVVFSTVLFLPLSLLLTVWVGRPLKIISDGLTDENADKLQALKDESSEFGTITRLILRANEQKILLVKEVQTRTEAEQALRRSERDYRELFENAHDAILIIDPVQFDVLQANREAARLYGYAQDEFMSLPLIKLWPSCSPELVEDIMQGRFPSYYETKHLRRDQSELVVEINAGIAQYRNQKVVVAISRDVTVKKLFEEVSMSHQILNRIGNMIIVFNNKGECIYANAATKHVLEYEPVELLGDGWWQITRKDAEERIQAKALKARKASGDILVNETPYLETYYKKNGSMVWIEWHDTWDPGQMFIRIAYDVTDRVRADHAQNQIEMQRVRMATVVETQEEERKRISRELHDSVGQQLSAIKRNIEIIKQRFTASTENAMSCDHLLSMVDTSLREIKLISYNLLPRVLDELGLISALDTLCRTQFGAQGIHVDFQTFDVDQRLPQDIELPIYRVVQEAFQNITKHAKATQVTLQLIGYDDHVVVTIEDNGIGFDLASMNEIKKAPFGMGLPGMRERIEFLSGKIDIDSSPGNGTSVVIEVPFKKK